MNTYIKFRSIGMTQFEAVHCAAIFLKRKEGIKISNDEDRYWDEMREKYREFWSLLI